MAELVIWVNSASSVSAAVQNGADAVCAALKTGTRPGLDVSEFYGAAQFCRVRGVRLYAEADYSPGDDGTEELLSSLRGAWLNGADALRLSDPGLILAVRKSMPDAPIHAGSQFCLHSKGGMKLASAMGISRVCLPAQMAWEDVCPLCGQGPEPELPIHGYLPPSYPGLCLIGGLSGRDSEKRSGGDLRFLSRYRLANKGTRPLVLPDLCLVDRLGEISGFGIHMLIDCRNRRPEYCAAVTGLYSRALSGVRFQKNSELAALDAVSPACGYTDALFMGKPLGTVRQDTATALPESSPMLSELRKTYIRREFQRVPVVFTARLSLGQPVVLTAEDDRGNTVSGEGGKVSLAFHREMNLGSLSTELYKTGGTPFLLKNVKAEIQRGVTADNEDIGEIRDKLLRELMDKRSAPPERRCGDMPPASRVPGQRDVPILSVCLTKLSQLSEELAALSPPMVYIPVTELASGSALLTGLIAREGVTVCASLPP
ncbi:MAG: DUF3656 domain-containing protein, partial [Oscillospiraceae bacterium]|nr:DUF3656 domain-containing protein [Oscillospiraceae bacterium]